jgi:hypothetical protein
LKLFRNAGRNLEVSVDFFGGIVLDCGEGGRKKEESREDFKIRDQKMVEKISWTA